MSFFKLGLQNMVQHQLIKTWKKLLEDAIHSNDRKSTRRGLTGHNNQGGNVHKIGSYNRKSN